MNRTTSWSCTNAITGCSRAYGLALALAVAAVAGVHAQPTAELPPTRGQLLYSNHCIECHTTQMHWRSQSLVRDWETLKAQVRRWQGVVSLGWNEADISEVARHLNDTIYQLPRPVSQLGLNVDPGVVPGR